MSMNPFSKVKGVDWYTHLQVDCVICVEEHRGRFEWVGVKNEDDLKPWVSYIDVCSHCNDRGRDPIPWTELFAGYRERKWEEK